MIFAYLDAIRCPRMEWWSSILNLFRRAHRQSAQFLLVTGQVAQPQVHHKHWEATEHAAGEGHVLSPESQGRSLCGDKGCEFRRMVV